MPVALHLDSLWSVLQLFDLTMLGVVDNVADALPLLLIPRRMLGRWLVRWRMLCCCCCWTVLCVGNLCDVVSFFLTGSVRRF